MRLKPASGAFALLAVATVCLTVAGSLLVRGAPSQTRRSWDELPVIAMKGGLQAFWNVTDRTKGENDAEAMRHGFAPLTILGTYADYPGNQKEHIGNFLGKKPANPWLKPPFFERIIRRNILETGTSGTFVNDIEIDFSEDMAKAFADESVRAASGTSDPAAFEEAYLKEWTSWFWLPSQWTRGKLEIDEAAHLLWHAKRPLVRRITVSPDECIVTAINPWQGDGETSVAKTTCGGWKVEIPMRGKHTGIFDVAAGVAVAH